MGIFDKKRSIPIRDLKETIRRDKGRIPGTGGRSYLRPEREKVLRETFGTKYGSDISKQDYRTAIRSLGSSARKTKDSAERTRIKNRISYLKGLGGKKI